MSTHFAQPRPSRSHLWNIRMGAYCSIGHHQVVRMGAYCCQTLSIGHCQVVHNTFQVSCESLQVKNIYQNLCEFIKYALEKSFLKKPFIFTVMRNITGQMWGLPEKVKREKRRGWRGHVNKSEPQW